MVVIGTEISVPIGIVTVILIMVIVIARRLGGATPGPGVRGLCRLAF
jgi:hypothetical protein